MHFRIEIDHTASRDDTMNRQGNHYSTQDAPAKPARSFPVVLYCYDDDGELYYTIGCSCEDAAERAHDWAQADAGCTYSTIAQRGETPSPFIG